MLREVTSTLTSKWVIDASRQHRVLEEGSGIERNGAHGERGVRS